MSEATKPVAYILEHEGEHDAQLRWPCDKLTGEHAGWAETPLYPATRIATLEAELQQTVVRADIMEARVAILAVRVATLEAALQQAAAWFQSYGDGHKAKGDVDKAERNFARAEACRAALVTKEAQP
jgi:hypothetical protein